MKANLPTRKPTRLKDYDYSSEGAYFITICTQDKQKILCDIVGDGRLPHGVREMSVGQRETGQSDPRRPANQIISNRQNRRKVYIINKQYSRING